MAKTLDVHVTFVAFLNIHSFIKLLIPFLVLLSSYWVGWGFDCQQFLRENEILQLEIVHMACAIFLQQIIHTICLVTAKCFFQWLLSWLLHK